MMLEKVLIAATFAVWVAMVLSMIKDEQGHSLLCAYVVSCEYE